MVGCAPQAPQPTAFRVEKPTAKVFFNIKKFKCNRKCGRAVGSHSTLNAVGQGVNGGLLPL